MTTREGTGFMQNNLLNKILWAYIFCMMAVVCYIYGIVVKANGDNVEHLHSAWLIWQGYIPYKDFFQHHNPLLWYISAPFVASLIDDIEIFSVFNIISELAVGVMAFFQCRLMALNGNNKTSVLFLAACIISSYSIMWALNYRPDTFMYACFFAGLFFLFKYMKYRRLGSLIISFLCLFLSFMFTQKILLNMVVPAFFLLYWLAKRDISVRDFFLSCVLPVLLAVAFIAYLYNNDALSVYWYSNFPYNKYIPDIFEQNRIIFPPKDNYEFYLFLPVAIIASVYFLIKGNSLERMLTLLFIEETLLRLFYFSAFLHYSIFWLILGMMLSIMFLDKCKKGRKTLTVIGILYLGVAVYYNYAVTYKKELPSHNYLNGHEYAFYNLTPCDSALNGYYAVYNLKARDAGYYWVLLGQIDVLGEKSGIAKRDNLNELILQKKPKIISAGVYWDTYWEQRGKKIPAHRIDQWLIETYYDYSGVGDIFILKPQYQRHNCLYNGKKWEFFD